MDKETRKEFLKKLIDLEINQADIGRDIGLSTQKINDIVAGRRKMIWARNKIARRVKMKVEYLWPDPVDIKEAA